MHCKAQTTDRDLKMAPSPLPRLSTTTANVPRYNDNYAGIIGDKLNLLSGQTLQLKIL
jgi:hypothetical protein